MYTIPAQDEASIGVKGTLSPETRRSVGIEVDAFSVEAWDLEVQISWCYKWRGMSMQSPLETTSLLV